MKDLHVTAAFKEQTITLPYKEKVPCSFIVKDIGKLKISTGKLVACDPLVCPETEAFDISLPAGEYPVQLAIAHIKDDQRVAYAKLIIKNQPVSSWKMALLSGQSLSKLQQDEYFGYSVDSGTGCFGDKHAMDVLCDKMTKVDDYYEKILNECDKTYVHTWSWCNLQIDDNLKSNVIVFSTGFGDGLYSTWIGYSEDGDIACVVTDFDIVFEDDESEQVETQGRKWWKFW